MHKPNFETLWFTRSELRLLKKCEAHPKQAFIVDSPNIRDSGLLVPASGKPDGLGGSIDSREMRAGKWLRPYLDQLRDRNLKRRDIKITWWISGFALLISIASFVSDLTQNRPPQQ